MTADAVTVTILAQAWHLSIPIRWRSGVKFSRSVAVAAVAASDSQRIADGNAGMNAAGCP